MADGVKFIRVRGRVIPIKEKKYVGSKTVDKDIKDRALSGFKKGANIGGQFGVGLGVTAEFVSSRSIFQAAKTGAIAGAKGAFAVGALGAVLGAAFGDRKFKKKVVKKKFSSI